MKKLLVLGGAAVHQKVVRAARALGVYTIVADYLPPECSPAKLLADEHLELNIFDVDELVAYGRDHSVDGVVGFCIDPTQRPAQAIAERLGLPVFGGRDQVVALTDKEVFKRKCREIGVDTIESYTEDDIVAGRGHYPLLVKPVDSRGSRGARCCESRDELLAAIPVAKAESSNGGCIIERYMTPDVNQDLTISYLVKDGRPVLVSVGDRHSGSREDNLDRQLVCTIQPSRFASEFLKKADPRLRRLIKHIGIENGPVFFQGFWDGSTVRLYDPGLRFPGNEYEQLLERATGINLMSSIVKYCVGGEIDFFDGQIDGCWDLGGRTCLQYMVNAGPGVLARFDGLDSVAEHPNVIDVTQKRFVGAIIEPTGDVRHRAAEISILCERNPAEMKRIVDFVQSKIVMQDDHGRNMCISPFERGIIDRWYSGYGGCS